MPEYWIQLHDYSSTTYENASLSRAKRAMYAFDWNSELDKFDEDDPNRNCPPGIGFSNGVPLTEPGAILLHVCPIDDEFVFLSVHCTEERKLLGLFPRLKETGNYIDPYEKSRVDSLIEHVYSGNHEALLAARK